LLDRSTHQTHCTSGCSRPYAWEITVSESSKLYSGYRKPSGSSQNAQRAMRTKQVRSLGTECSAHDYADRRQALDEKKVLYWTRLVGAIVHDSTPENATRSAGPHSILPCYPYPLTPHPLLHPLHALRSPPTLNRPFRQFLYGAVAFKPFKTHLLANLVQIRRPHLALPSSRLLDVSFPSRRSSPH
jgi:hypothetical protein